MKYSRPKSRSNKGPSNFRPKPGMKKNYNHDNSQILSERDYHHAFQTMNKYLDLAKSADATGNNVDAQSFYQQAEHYSRIINERNEFIAASQIQEPLEENIEQIAEDSNPVQKKQIKYRRHKNHSVINNQDEVPNN